MELDSAQYIAVLKEELAKVNEERLFLLALVRQLTQSEEANDGSVEG